jgi:hypothetical protein
MPTDQVAAPEQGAVKLTDEQEQAIEWLWDVFSKFDHQGNRHAQVLLELLKRR